MALSCDASLVSLAADFAGRYAPYNAIELKPNPQGGVFVAATDRGNAALLAYDSSGKADEREIILPTAELVKACKPLKTADRLLEINGERGRVITLRKSANQAVDVTIHRPAGDFPPLADVMKKVCSLWGKDPGMAVTAGRYDIAYLMKAVRAIEQRNASVVLTSFDGGPLRIQADDGSLCCLVMGQSKDPIPQLPGFLESYAVS